MRPQWAANYLQIPFAERGRTAQGLDCYGLVRHVFQQERHIVLPSYAEDYTTTTDIEEVSALFRGALVSLWREVPLTLAQTFDVAILRILGEPIHCGLVLDPPEFLHIRRKTLSTIERWDSFIWKRRLISIVRWQHGQ